MKIVWAYITISRTKNKFWNFRFTRVIMYAMQIRFLEWRRTQKMTNCNICSHFYGQLIPELPRLSTHMPHMAQCLWFPKISLRNRWVREREVVPKPSILSALIYLWQSCMCQNSRTKNVPIFKWGFQSLFTVELQHLLLTSHLVMDTTIATTAKVRQIEVHWKFDFCGNVSCVRISKYHPPL